MRSPLTETIRRVEGMITYVRENLDEGEYDLFLDLILPEPEPVKAVKKGRKKSSKGGSKSSRAQSLSGVIQRTPKPRISDDNEDDNRCAYRLGEDGGSAIICDALIDNNVHHKTTDPDYHPFVSTAQPARGKSSTNGGAGSESEESASQMSA